MPISVIGSLPVTKNLPNLSLVTKSMTYSSDIMCYEMDFFFCRCKEICCWNPILSLSDKFWQRQVFYETPPGLVVTRASCYSCVFSKTRRQQEFSVISDEKHFKTALHRKFGDHIRQKEKVMAKKLIFTSPSNCLHFRKYSPCAKNIQLHLEIDKVGK